MSEPRMNQVCACGHGAVLHDQTVDVYPCKVDGCGCQAWT